MTTITSKEQFALMVSEVEEDPNYMRPDAFGIGITTYDRSGERPLETRFPVPNFEGNYGTAAAICRVLGSGVSLTSNEEPYSLNSNELRQLLECFKPFMGDDNRSHPNIRLLETLIDSGSIPPRSRYEIVFIGDLSEPPRSVQDIYLRLHLLSHRLVKPNTINLDDIFKKLPNVAWTNEGPMLPEEVSSRQLAARLRCEHRGDRWAYPLRVHSVDKFPQMADYVVPSGVRIADASRVRLGAYLGESTTVMHEGFVNFNAGTLGKSMVEGRISAGVIVDDGSDLGGSASIMGTLSGGGTEVISIGERCLIGANAGTGISLGDDVKIQSGVYITADLRVWYGGKFVKARTLSGISGVVFRHNNEQHRIEVVPNKGAVSLNEALHNND